MAQPKTLTDAQVALLRWIADGCPDGVMDDSFHRISAAALRRRGLVRISGRGTAWSARATNAGREYLAQAEGPTPPKARQPNVSVTQQLVDEIIAAGGSLRVPRKGWSSPDAIDYERRAHLAMRHGKVPPGKGLAVTASGAEVEIRLLDMPESAQGQPDLLPVPVPTRVGRYHRAVRDFRDGTARHMVSRASLARAVRILQAIASEAERRGWEVQGAAEPVEPARTAPSGSGRGPDLVIRVSEETFSLRLLEEGVHARGAWEEEVHRYRNVSSDWASYRDRELPRGPYDANASGRLRLELLVARPWIFKERQWRWADRQSWTLEERLPHLFREIEERIVEAQRVAEEQRIAAEEAAERAKLEAEERERRWNVLIEDARRELIEEQRARQLRAQATAWREATLLRDYCDAMANSYGDRPETEQWLAWARQHVSQIDPLAQPPAMPPAPTPTSEELQPFLPDGWSADGPHVRMHRGYEAYRGGHL